MAYPPKNLVPKTSKFGTILGNFRVCSWIFPQQMDVSKIRKTHDQQLFLPHSSKKSRVNVIPLTTKLDMWVWICPNRLFQKTIFWPLGVLWLSNFYTH